MARSGPSAFHRLSPSTLSTYLRPDDLQVRLHYLRHAQQVATREQRSRNRNPARWIFLAGFLVLGLLIELFTH